MMTDVPTGKTPQTRTGFTLIEMLVVVAIITLLASILVPTVTSALARAKRLKCQSHLRQLSQACLLASMEDKGRFPSLLNYTFDASGWIQEGSEFPRPGGPEPEPWGIALAPFLSMPPADTVWVDPAEIPSVFRCPGAEANSVIRREYDWVFECAHYRYNSYAAGRSLDIAAAPSEAMLFIDAVWPGWSKEAHAHQDLPGVTLVYADGHVGSLRYQDYQDLSPNTDYQNPLYLKGWFGK